ncbi:MAG: histidine kinase [Bacteroidetes bacterium]|nr:histidine kinase [Bacteroidota bacterium]
MKRKYKILIHFIYWVYILNQGLFGLLLEKESISPYYYQDLFWSTFLNMFSFYSVYIFLPFLFRYKYKTLSFLIGLMIVLAATSIRIPVDFCFWKYIIHLPEKDLVIKSSWIWNELRLGIITGIYAVLIRITINWFESQKLKAELINQNQASELALLRSQINPHFLFNTLNNIYSLVYKKSDDAPEAVMKLSSIMRYTLYDSNADKVFLEKEIEFLKSFIELQQLRLKTPNFVEFNLNGSVEGIMIAPMLFISFVENSFKHGSKKVASPGIIITLTINEKNTLFEVMNYVRNDEIQNKDIAGGIGLQNIKRRLELIYKDKHKLDININDDKYIVKLEIENK